MLRHDVVVPMGRVGAAGDNAAMGSFFSLLQKNVLDRRAWATRAELRIEIVTWVERTYHRRRRQAARSRRPHPYLKTVPPVLRGRGAARSGGEQGRGAARSSGARCSRGRAVRRGPGVQEREAVFKRQVPRGEIAVSVRPPRAGQTRLPPQRACYVDATTTRGRNGPWHARVVAVLASFRPGCSATHS